MATLAENLEVSSRPEAIKNQFLVTSSQNPPGFSPISAAIPSSGGSLQSSCLKTLEDQCLAQSLFMEVMGDHYSLSVESCPDSVGSSSSLRTESPGKKLSKSLSIENQENLSSILSSCNGRALPASSDVGHQSLATFYCNGTGSASNPTVREFSYGSKTSSHQLDVQEEIQVDREESVSLEGKEGEYESIEKTPYIFRGDLSNHWSSSFCQRRPSMFDSPLAVQRPPVRELEEARDSSYLSSINETEPTGVGAGLSNLGNTCFMNSVLQCFTHTMPLVLGLRTFNHATPCDCTSEEFCVFCVLYDHIELSIASSGKTIAPCKLADNLNYFSSYFQRYQQEDAHEFLQCLLDKLERCCLDSNKKDNSLSSNKANIVEQVFGGRLVSKLRCCNCGHCSDTYEPLIDLSLEIEDARTLASALESFTKVEKIDDPEMKFICENCKEKVSVEKQLMLDQAPSIAAFHLKRFKTDGSYIEKIDEHVEFPLELDLQPYTSGRQNKDELKYQLYAIVEHIGYSSTSGHYFCYIRSDPDTWHRMDDSKVRRVEEEFVLSQNAYILFYARQGSPWFSNLPEVQKQYANISSSSPKSVLDNVHIDANSLLGVGKNGTSKIDNSRNVAEGPSSLFSCKTEHVEFEVIEAMDSAEAPTYSTHGFGQDVSVSNDSRIDVPKAEASMELKENIVNQGIHKIRGNGHLNPKTPPRSPSPVTHSREPQDKGYQIPKDHLKPEKGASRKRPLNKSPDNSQRMEAFRYAKRMMPSSRSLKFIDAMQGNRGGGVNKKKSMRPSPCKNRKQNHSSVARPLAVLR